jgi:glycosyltransferase involved in cell wall biosynthesis
VYNRRESLIRAITSVLNQTRCPDEIIVMDDGSEPEVSVYLQQEHPRLAEQVVVIRQATNGGVSKARNLAFQNSSGSLIALLDSDDEWHPDKLARQVAWFEKNSQIDLVSCQQWVVRGNGQQHERRKLYREGIFDHLINGWRPPTPSSLLLKRELLEKIPFDESIRYLEDLDWWLKFSLLTPTIEYVDAYLMYYHTNETNRLSYVASRERFFKIERLLSRWEPVLVQKKGKKKYRAFRNHLLTFNAVDAFVVYIRNRRFVSAGQIAIKYLWYKKKFYHMVGQRILRWISV